MRSILTGLIRTRATGILLVVLLAVLFLASLAARPRIETNLLAEARTSAEATLSLVTSAVDQAIRQYEPIPGLIGVDPAYRELLLDPQNEGLIPFVNEKLRHIVTAVGASDVYVMDRDGTTIAASNYREETSFVGRNFSYRPYFQRALAGEVTQFHALGTTSGERGFFFAAPILDGINVIGVMVIKVTIDSFEQTWVGTPSEVLVTDPNGVVFMSSRTDYRLRTLAPLPEGSVERIAETRQFPLEAISPIPFSANVIAPNAIEVTLGSEAEATDYLTVSRPLDLAGWHAIVLTPLKPIRLQALSYLGVLNLAALTLTLAILVVVQRRARILERIRTEQSQRDLLEHRVALRTAELKAANQNIMQEVEERRAAEDRLRQTQTELIQAGKLAALGQMSAALSHEFNQPLAAVKSFARNAQAYLDRDQPDKVRQNVGMIDDMVDRLAAISTHLRNFARRPGEKTEPILLNRAVDAALAILEPKLRSAGCRVNGPEDGDEIWVLGGQVRLQQVIVNLLSNAVDAMSDQPDPVIDLSIEGDGGEIRVAVRDRGPGMTEDEIARLFDPFFTTKDPGKGMGLGLSISYNIVRDFGGTLEGRNHPDGGALFAVTLRRADAPSMAAAE